MKSNNQILMSHKNIQQLLFIDRELFQFQWEFNQNIKDYDFMVTLPVIQSEDRRIHETRNKIVEFLVEKEG